jgi:Ca-activated chloride channel family protein
MSFSDPNWLLAGLLTCLLLVGLWRRYDARQHSALAQFVAPHLRSKLTGSVSAVRRLLQRGLFLASVLCLCAALAGPLLGYHWERISRRGNEVVFAIDTSRSMLTADVKPNRLTRAKLAIDDMARQLDGDGIGIVAFAGSAFLVCPLTFDYAAFHQSLDAIDVHTIPRGGTNIPSAIVAARAALSRRPGSDRILILVTDGENLEGDALAAARDAARQDGMKIYTVGVGTVEGDLIPLPLDEGGGSVRDETGAFVKSHLDEAGLTAIAAATAGAYVHLGGQGDDFEAFLRTVFGSVTRHDLIYRQQRIYNQRYQWPLTASLTMLLASLVMGTRRSTRRRAPALSRTLTASAASAASVASAASAVSAASVVSAVSAVMVLIGVLAVPVRSRSAQADDRSTMGDTRTPVVEYNAGTSAYRAGQFPQATQSFQRSIKTAPASDEKRLADQEDAYYNLGNALYRAGQQLEKSAPQQAIQKWTEAVKAYDTALQLRADDADSKYNRDFVNRKIDALRRPPDQGGGGGGGGGGGQGQGNGKGQGHSQGQAQGQGQAGQGQGQGKDQGRGQAQGQPPQGQPPQGQPSPQGQPQQASPQSPRNDSPPPDRKGGPGDEGDENDERPAAEDQRPPGQMSVAEARELLDSAKSDEHQSLGVPSGPRDPDQTPDKPFKNW